MIEGACLCGTVRWQFDDQCDGATACHCTACRRDGAFWADDHEDEGIRVIGETRAFARGTALAFLFCPACGCLVVWRARGTDTAGRRRIAVNLRLAEPAAVARIPMDRFDGLDAFEDLPRNGRCVADLLVPASWQ